MNLNGTYEWPPPNLNTTPPQGWECPRCRKVHSPFVKECYCDPPSYWTTGYTGYTTPQLGDSPNQLKST